VFSGVLIFWCSACRYLNKNRIPVIHNFEFKNLMISKTDKRDRIVIEMRGCGIERIEESPFVNLGITDLNLSLNNLTDEGLGRGLNGITHLNVLQLTHNFLQSVPEIGLDSPDLTDVYLTRNNISSISRESFKNMTNLRTLHLSVNPLEGFPENDDTFAEIPNLETLEIEDTRVGRLPNLFHLPNLVHLYASYAELADIPESMCGPKTNLKSLHVNHNRIKQLPVMNCSRLIDFQASQNEITEVHMQTLHGMPLINKLYLSDNAIQHLDSNIFNNSVNIEILELGGNRLEELPDLRFMRHLFMLNASHNLIREIKMGTFTEQLGMDILYLNDNRISTIHSNAFSRGSDLKKLNLSNNYELREFNLPPGGFQRLVELEMQNLWSLHQVPSQYQIPKAIKLLFTYSYHCCIWKDYIIPDLTRPNVEDQINDAYYVTPEPVFPTLPPEIKGCSNIANLFETYINYSIFAEANRVFLEMDEECRVHVLALTKANITKIREELENFRYYYYEWEPGNIHDTSRRGFDYVIEYVVEVSCKPLQNPLTPCENLMDPWFLRVAIWAVWVIALLGNGTVLFVGIASKEKLDSSEFLICNLACADLGMGLYLIFLATVDIRTFGSGTFFQSALDWQLGAGCKSAGFIAIFSNQLSLFILVILTLERVYTIASAFNQNEAKKKRVAMGLCAAGWLVAALVASLPLVGVNSYNRVAVCLPYLTSTWLDKLYISLVLSGNLIGFVVILLSYVYIFTSACYNTPSTHMPQRRKDITVAASKIAILILTAFFCWAPMAIIGFPALAGVHLVTAAQAKYFLVFVFPLNACVNPFIYAIFTNRFRQKFASIFQRSNDKMTTFPPHHSMRLQRTVSAFTSETQLSRVGSSQSRNTVDEMTRKRQKRRSNSLVVQLMEDTPSLAPGFIPPPGCNLGRRASLPPGFGSTLPSATGGHRSPSRLPSVPHSVLPFIPSPLNSSNTSSLPDLPEEADMEDSKSIYSYSQMESKPLPLTSSQESNLRRLSVVREDEGEIEAPSLLMPGCGLEDDSEDEYSIASSLDEYMDAKDTLQYVMEEEGTDLDGALQGGSRRMLGETNNQDMEAGDAEKLSQDSSDSEEATRKVFRRGSFDFTGADVRARSPTLRRKSSSWSDISSLNEDHSLSPLQSAVFATVEERFNSPWLFPPLSSSPEHHCTSSHTESPKVSFAAEHHSLGIDPSSTPSFLETRSSQCSPADTPSEEDKRAHPLNNCYQQRLITTSRSNSISSSSTSSGQYTGIRQGLVLSSLHSKPTPGPSSSIDQIPIEHTNHEHQNSSPLLLSSSSSHHNDNGTDSPTSVSIETEV